MTTYLEQLKNRTEINIHKLKSLHEYKASLLASKDKFDSDLLDDRLKQIDVEDARLKKAIHANRKAEAHYNAAFGHLVDLRSLDSKLQLTTDPLVKAEIEKEVLKHTSKLEKHLAILPEKLVVELQEKYLQYAEANPIIIEDNIQTESKADDDVNYEIYANLFDIYQNEVQELNEIKVFETVEDLEAFLDKYKEMKIACYRQLKDAKVEETATVSHNEAEVNQPVVESNHIEDKYEDEPSVYSIIVMLSLIDGLEGKNAADAKLHATNVKTSAAFKEELSSSGWLYNVVRFSGDIAKVEEVSYSEFIKSVSTSKKNIERIEVLRERINNLSESKLMNVYRKYYGPNSKASLTTALKVLISERALELMH